MASVERLQALGGGGRGALMCARFCRSHPWLPVLGCLKYRGCRRRELARRRLSAEGLHRELTSRGPAGVQVLVSLLPAEEAEMLAVAREAAACSKCELEFRSLPIEDQGVPADAQEVVSPGGTSHRSLAFGPERFHSLSGGDRKVGDARLCPPGLPRHSAPGGSRVCLTSARVPSSSD